MPQVPLIPSMEGYVAEWALLETRATGIPPLGVLLADEHRIYVRMRPDWREAVPQEDSDILRDYETYIPEIADEVGVAQVLDWFEASSMLPIRIAARQKLQLTDANLALEDLYHERVLLQPPKPANPKVELESAPSRSTPLTVLDRLTFRRSYKVFLTIAIPVVMAALLLLQRQILLQRYSQTSKSSLPQQGLLPNPLDISELPLTSVVDIKPSYLSAPVLLRHPAIHARREKAPVRRQFEGDVIIDVSPPVLQPTILPTAPALGIAANVRPQRSLLPIPLPAAAPFPAKQNRLLHFFSVLFHNAPQKNGADDEHNQKNNEHEIETTVGSTGRAIQGLR